VSVVEGCRTGRGREGDASREIASRASLQNAPTSRTTDDYAKLNLSHGRLLEHVHLAHQWHGRACRLENVIRPGRRRICVAKDLYNNFRLKSRCCFRRLHRLRPYRLATRMDHWFPHASTFREGFSWTHHSPRLASKGTHSHGLRVETSKWRCTFGGRILVPFTVCRV